MNVRPLAVLLLLAGCAPPMTADPKPVDIVDTPSMARPIDALIERLQSDGLELRDAAARELLAMGPIAEPELRRALAASDVPEVRVRLAAILESIEIAGLPALPTEGLLGDVRISLMHTFAWQTPPRGEHTFVSSVWRFENGGSTEVAIRIARARFVAGGEPRDVRPHGTKLDPDPTYPMTPGQVWKPAIKLPECPAFPAGSLVYAVFDFSDGSGRTLRLRTKDAGVEKTE